MTIYRAYRLHGLGRILDGQWLEASNDAQTRNQAEALCEEARAHLRLCKRSACWTR